MSILYLTESGMGFLTPAGWVIYNPATHKLELVVPEKDPRWLNAAAAAIESTAALLLDSKGVKGSESMQANAMKFLESVSIAVTTEVKAKTAGTISKPM
jgi:hypothetical protein